MTKNIIMIIVIDQCNVEELHRKISREYAKHIWNSEVIMADDEKTVNIYPFQVEDYADDEEG